MLQNKQLTKDFTLYDLLYNDVANKRGVVEQYNPSQEIINNLTNICINILQPLKDKLKTDIKIIAGYKCLELDKTVKKKSQYLNGQAVDIILPQKGNGYLYNKIVEFNLPYDQLIWQKGNKTNPEYVTVSYGPKNRRAKLSTI